MTLSDRKRQHLKELHARVRRRSAKEHASLDSQVLRWRAEGLTFARIAIRLGVNRSRAHQIVRAAERRAAWPKEPSPRELGEAIHHALVERVEAIEVDPATEISYGRYDVRAKAARNVTPKEQA